MCDPVLQQLRHCFGAKSMGHEWKQSLWLERHREKVRQAVSIYMTMSATLTHSTCTS